MQNENPRCLKYCLQKHEVLKLLKKLFLFLIHNIIAVDIIAAA